MSRRVLLISANRCAIPDPVFPLGLAHIDAALRDAGHTTRWLDALISPEPLEAVLETFAPDLVGISLRNVDDVLIRKRETYYEDLTALCARIRAGRACPIVLGGSGFSIFPRELLAASGADYGICGAGETALPQLVDALDDRPRRERIQGLVFRHEHQVIINPPAALVPPSRLGDSSLPRQILEGYLRNSGMLNVQTQRGCAFQCCYCTYPLIEGRGHRRRAPEEVADDFARAARCGAKYVFIVDSVFNSSPRHVREICEAILRRDFKISWGCFLRPQGLTPELVELMARAGLAHVEFGTDSFSDEVLTAYRKGFTFDDVHRSTELMFQRKIDCCHFLICGGPGETRETLREGFRQSERLRGAVMMAVVGMRIYPGTDLHRRALEEGVIGPGEDLLNPVYYVSPALNADEVFALLAEQAGRAPNWISGDPSPAYASLVERLRRRGVVGPLWSYFSMLQRLWPHGAPTAPNTVPA